MDLLDAQKMEIFLIRWSNISFSIS